MFRSQREGRKGRLSVGIRSIFVLLLPEICLSIKGEFCMLTNMQNPHPAQRYVRPSEQGLLCEQDIYLCTA